MMDHLDAIPQALWATVWAENSVVGRSIILLILTLGLLACARWWRHARRFDWERWQLRAVQEQLRAVRPQQQGLSYSATEVRGVSDASYRASGQRAPSVSADDDSGDEESVGAEPESENSEGDGVDSKTDPEVDAFHSGEVGPIDEPPQVAWNSVPVDVLMLREASIAGSLIYERLDAINRLRQQQVKVNLQTLQGLTQARVAARKGLEAPARVSNLVMVLGILGTFIGLAVMAQEIRWALPLGDTVPEIDSWLQGFENVAQLMSGIKTAFSTSLVGMATALLLTILSHRLEDREAFFLEEFERFTVEDLLPATVPTLEGKDLLERISFKLENSFDHLRDVFTRNHDILESLNGVQVSYLEILDGVRGLLRRDATEQLDEVISSLKLTQQQVARVVDTVPELARSIEKSQGQLTEKISSLVSRFTRFGDRQLMNWFLGSFGAGLLVFALLVLACLYWLLVQIQALV